MPQIQNIMTILGGIMKDYINAIVQAIVQGLSEFLPISSSKS